LHLLILVSLSIVANAQTPTANPQTATPVANQKPMVRERVEVTATRRPEDPQEVPTAIEVFTGEELAARGATDLRTALSPAIGVEIAPGGDSGPAGSVPDFWGLKEFDAFLLVVDGVPWGGAFNPALTTLSLSDVERIEVIRGPAPVTYGATSFVGVIHVVHKGTESGDRTLVLHGGSYATGGGSFSTAIPLVSDWKSRLTVEGERLGFSDDRTAYRRGHGQWRVDRGAVDSGRTWLNFDLNWLDQDPASPRNREGTALSPLVAIDSNYNPAGAFLNDHRGTIGGGYDRKVRNGQWFTNVSFSHSRQDVFRGFLEEIADDPDNAHGVREKLHLTDLYLDTHYTGKLRPSLSFLFGADYLHGTGNAHGADFEYTIPLNGPAAVVPEPTSLDVSINDQRNFFGAYGALEWTPMSRLRIDAGVRLNATAEDRHDADPGAGTADADERDEVRASGNIGAIVTAWQHDQDSLRFYANYRDTFKPAAIDFGIGEGFLGRLILEPETSRSIEGGLKGQFWNRRMEAEISGFLMNFENLVTPVEIGGLPGLINAGKQRFQGMESGVSFYFPRDVMAKASYSYHDAHFTDFVQDFGGVPTQLAGKRLEMSANHLASFGIWYLPVRGLIGGFDVNYRGSVFLNKRNTALAEGFATFGVSAGYRTPRWELRLDARNLSDRRDPVSESELGDAQYYLMPSRRVDGTLTFHF
jgi:outer membrane receptor protein involved in Fe transport